MELALGKMQSNYLSGMKRCYKQVLKATPRAAGAVTLEFAVNDTGRVVNPAVTSFDATLQTCLEAQLRNWRFPIPKDPDGEPMIATFRFGFGLVPD
ncbi:MAG: AgmX/PglI C-terminal domain-containing protein [Deltaproteobacteria bacterium]|nr:AgmX/PglI C-terminal domain-containing protein [Deltaproteobacteria bacterium]